MKLWKCEVCGYVAEGEEAPNRCPKCGVLKDKFVMISEEDAAKIYRSDKTNDLHMQLIRLAMKMDDIAKQGIEDNLDPGCVKVFEAAKAHAWELKQMAKAELAGHIAKGKF